MENYKKKYADYFGIEWDSSKYEIHHIDRDRANNDINNLVLLPKDLHRELHEKRYFVDNSFDVARFETKLLNGINELESYYTKEYLNFCSKLIYWGFIKNVKYRRCSGEPMDMNNLEPEQNGWW